MRLRNLAIIAITLSVVGGCQNRTESEKNQNETQSQADPFQADPDQLRQQADNVTDEELVQFLAAMEDMQMINQSAQQEMIEAVQDGGMEVQRFSEIMQSQQDPNMQSDATSEEMEQYTEVNKSLEEIQILAQQQMEEKIEEGGLSTERYQEIGAIIQYSPELQEKIQTMMNIPQQ
jgi:hypothetical protein